MFWSYLLMAVGVVGLLLVGQKYKAGWIVGLAAQGLWVAYGLVTAQYGFIVSAVAYGISYYLGLRRALQDRHENEWRPIGLLDDEGIKKPVDGPCQHDGVHWLDDSEPYVVSLADQVKFESALSENLKTTQQAAAKRRREEQKEVVLEALAEFRDNPSSFVRDINLDYNKTATLPSTDFEDWKKAQALLPKDETSKPWWSQHTSVHCLHGYHDRCDGRTYNFTLEKTECECSCHETKENDAKTSD